MGDNVAPWNSPLFSPSDNTISFALLSTHISSKSTWFCLPVSFPLPYLPMNELCRHVARLQPAGAEQAGISIDTIEPTQFLSRNPSDLRTC